MLINESKFNMWRATIYLVGLDGKVSLEEREWLNNYLAKVPFSEDQKEQIDKDLSTGIDNFKEVYSKITYAPDRATLTHFANMIFRADDFAQIEKDFLLSLKQSVMKEVDMVKALDQVDAIASKPTNRSFVQKAYDFMIGVWRE